MERIKFVNRGTTAIILTVLFLGVLAFSMPLLTSSHLYFLLNPFAVTSARMSFTSVPTDVLDACQGALEMLWET